MTDLPEWAKELVEPVARAICHANDMCNGCEHPCKIAILNFEHEATAALADALPKIAEHLGRVGYVACALTRHVSLGEEVEAAIRREVTRRKP